MMLSMVVGFMLKLPRLLEQHKTGFSSSLTSKVVGVYPTAFFFCRHDWSDAGPVLVFGEIKDEAPVAQWIEHLPSKQRAAGSSPAGGTNL